MYKEDRVAYNYKFKYVAQSNKLKAHRKKCQLYLQRGDAFE